MENFDLLQELIKQGTIQLSPSILLESVPTPLPDDFDFDRVRGMLLGLAIGDSLGNTSESMNPHERKQLYGEIRDYLPNKYAGQKRQGLPSDDTQMAFWTLEALLEDGRLVPDHLARKFTQQQIFGIGSTVKGFLRAFKDHGISWEKAGQRSAGNGALMRIAPVLIPHLTNPSPGLWADAALAGMITHNDGASNAACIAFVHLLWDVLRLKEVPQGGWWINTFCSWAKELETGAIYETRNTSIRYSGPFTQFVEQSVGQAVELNMSTLDACNFWHSGAYLLETVPCVLYILEKYGRDPEEAVIHAVNDTRDNDTVAAIVGAAVGALHGEQRLPSRWIQNLLGRTGANDDGKIQNLIELACKKFWKE
jgi:ADP-ribosylglycohydrolase